MALAIPNNNTPIACPDGTATRAMQLFMAGVAPSILNFSVTRLPVAVFPMLATVSDAADASLAWGAAITSTSVGTTKYLALYNGTKWTVLGK